MSMIPQQAIRITVSQPARLLRTSLRIGFAPSAVWEKTNSKKHK